MNIRSKANYYLSLRYNELENECGRNYQKVYNYIKENYSDINPNHLLVGFIFTSITIDGKFTEKEWQFIRSFVGNYSYDDAFEIGNSFYNNEAKETTKQVLKLFPEEIKEATINIILGVLCVDGRYNNEEVSFVNYLFD